MSSADRKQPDAAGSADQSPPSTPQIHLGDPRQVNANSAQFIDAIANRYGDVALPETPKQFIVLQSGDDGATLNEKHVLVEAAQKSILREDAQGPHLAPSDHADSLSSQTIEKKLDVLRAMSGIVAPEIAHSHTNLRSGVVNVAPDDGQIVLPLEGGGGTATAVAMLHELGHANLAQLDLQKNGYLDASVNKTGATPVSGWDREVPADVLQAMRAITNCPETTPLPREFFASAEAFQKHSDSVSLLNDESKHFAVKTVHVLVHEAYADSFSILSIAAKDGAEKGGDLAKSLRTFRLSEADAVARDGGGEIDTHDTSRGLMWLATYLKSGQGNRLLTALASHEGAPRAEMLHEAALKFATLNVNKWAKDHGATSEQAERISSWIGETYKKEDAALQSLRDIRGGPASGQKPEVYAFTKETISALSGKSSELARSELPFAESAKSERTMERTLERQR
jgi:hypothetical protein